MSRKLTETYKEIDRDSFVIDIVTETNKYEYKTITYNINNTQTLLLKYVISITNTFTYHLTLIITENFTR